MISLFIGSMIFLNINDSVEYKQNLVPSPIGNFNFLILLGWLVWLIVSLTTLEMTERKTRKYQSGKIFFSKIR